MRFISFVAVYTKAFFLLQMNFAEECQTPVSNRARFYYLLQLSLNKFRFIKKNDSFICVLAYRSTIIDWRQNINMTLRRDGIRQAHGSA